MALYQLAFEAGITFAPGPLFAVDDTFAHHVRLNCGEKLDARRRDALIRLGELACVWPTATRACNCPDNASP
ncbi:hypothetical protein WL08_03375 [Burkholderia ubonensis]|nr:hypothetical protein WL08_03375 [Burkholderia ubonensis]